MVLGRGRCNCLAKFGLEKGYNCGQDSSATSMCLHISKGVHPQVFRISRHWQGINFSLTL